MKNDHRSSSFVVLMLLLALVSVACGGDPSVATTPELPEVVDSGDTADGPDFERAPAPPTDGIYGFANGCYAVEGFDGVARPRFVGGSDDGATFAFVADDAAGAARFRLRATDLGSYLLYDAERRYLVAEAVGDAGDTASQWRFGRVAALDSDIELLDDGFRSPAEWVVEVSARDPERFQLKHYRTGRYLALDGLTTDAAGAAVITFFEQAGCAEFPELTIDAVGSVVPRTWDDGDVYGIAEVHSHLMTNFGFGGGGMFHGAAFHRLGVEHALGSCEKFHGEDGRRDVIGLFYDGNLAMDIDALLPIVLKGESSEFNHHTAGYPDFTDWPNGWKSSTHQTTYYRWIERAYLAGLRLQVELATGNSVLCEFVTGIGAQDVRYSCNDMVSVDRSIEAVRALERYVDAQYGGPGKGWFRVVESPAEARDVITQGKLAVVLGIEISNLFDCFLTPRDGFAACDEASVRADLDRYHALGVRVIFPVHKFDNAFSPGDGQGGVIELGNFINSGHYTNKVEDCPAGGGFDSGGLTFGDLNKPREVYDSPAPVDMGAFQQNPVAALLPFLSELKSGPVSGNFCQKAGMTALGETLVRELMQRGMIVDLAHLPRRSVQRVLEILKESDYPATSTHAQTYAGDLYRIGGMSQAGFGSCGDPTAADTMGAGFRARIQERTGYGLYPAEGLGFDANGFAGARRPRFGENSHCPQPQANPVSYPFSSYSGDVLFHEPHLGNRTVDFNTEGMIHIGLLPELIEDVRRDGMSDADLEPLFRSAETYLRLWERAEERAAELPKP